MHNCRYPKLLCLLVTVIGILVDQLTKWLVATTMTLGESIPLLEGVLHITYIHNRGAAFGMLADRRWVFLVVSSITIVAIIVFLCLTKIRDGLSLISLSLILSGGIGNMIDRLALGYVIDFIDFRIINFAVFNGADSFVCVGAALFFLAAILDMRRESAAAKSAAGSALLDAAADAVREAASHLDETAEGESSADDSHDTQN